LQIIKWVIDLLQDELIWGAAWLFKATREPKYGNYVVENIHILGNSIGYAEFGWDTKHAGINILVSKVIKCIN
jgi:endoglucanase